MYNMYHTYYHIDIILCSVSSFIYYCNSINSIQLIWYNTKILQNLIEQPSVTGQQYIGTKLENYTLK